MCVVFCFQAEDGIRDLVLSRGLGDVYKRQAEGLVKRLRSLVKVGAGATANIGPKQLAEWRRQLCLLYTSDAADERSSVDLGGRRIIKKKRTT